MTRRHARGWSVAGCAAVLLVPVALGASPTPSASASPAGVGKLEHRPVLEQLGVPRRRAMRLAPLFRTGFERDEDLAGFYPSLTRGVVRNDDIAIFRVSR
jgi:hypothetical protein